MKVTQEDHKYLMELLEEVSQRMTYSGKVEDVFAFSSAYSKVHAFIQRIKNDLDTPPPVADVIPVVTIDEEPKKAPAKRPRKKKNVGDRK